MQQLEKQVEEWKKAFDLQDVKIKVRGRTPTRFETAHGSVHKDKDGWTIESVGSGFYIPYHEFLHIVLEETGRFFEPTAPKKKHATYLFELKNLFDDYLIESRMRREFKGKYQDSFEIMRLKNNLYASVLEMPGARINSTQMFMDLLSLRNICMNIYPELKEHYEATIVGEIIKSERIDNVVKICLDYSFDSTDSLAYKEGVGRIHEALTASPLEFVGKNFVRFDSLSLDGFLEGVDEMKSLLCSSR